jgi:hypothetical protein
MLVGKCDINLPRKISMLPNFCAYSRTWHEVSLWRHETPLVASDLCEFVASHRHPEWVFIQVSYSTILELARQVSPEGDNIHSYWR